MKYLPCVKYEIIYFVNCEIFRLCGKRNKINPLTPDRAFHKSARIYFIIFEGDRK